jgi:hypothetical protein
MRRALTQSWHIWPRVTFYVTSRQLNPIVIYPTYNDVASSSYDFFIIISFDEAILFTGYEPKHRYSFSHFSFILTPSLSSMGFSHDPHSLTVLRLTWIKLSLPHPFHLSSIHPIYVPHLIVSRATESSRL